MMRVGSESLELAVFVARRMRNIQTTAATATEGPSKRCASASVNWRLYLKLEYPPRSMTVGTSWGEYREGVVLQELPNAVVHSEERR